MKNKLTLALTATLLIASTTIAYGASWSNQGTKDERSTAREELRTEMSAVKDTMLQDRETLREKIKAGELDVMQKVGALHAISVSTRASFYYKRLKSIYDRLGKAITDAETKYGVTELSQAKSLWTQAGIKLEDAKKTADQAVADFRSVTGPDLSSQKKEVFAARDEVKKALSLFRESTKLMKDANKELRKVLLAHKESPSPKPSKSPEASESPESEGVKGNKNKPNFSPVPPVLKD